MEYVAALDVSSRATVFDADLGEGGWMSKALLRGCDGVIKTDVRVESRPSLVRPAPGTIFVRGFVGFVSDDKPPLRCVVVVRGQFACITPLSDLTLVVEFGCVRNLVLTMSALLRTSLIACLCASKSG